MPALDEDDARRRFAAARVARLASVSADGQPHLVPVVFAVDGDRVLMAVDQKPKRHRALKRLRNIDDNPAVSLLVDRYDDDWSTLWWVRADGVATVSDAEPDRDTLTALHKAIDGVRTDLPAMHYNTAVAKLIELANHLTKTYPHGGAPRSVIEPLVLLLAPLCPHLGEELWSRLGHAETLAYAPFPEADPALLVEDSVEYPIQVNGKVRSRITVPAVAGEDDVRTAALGDAKVVELLAGAEPRKVIVVPGRLVNIVR